MLRLEGIPVSPGYASGFAVIYGMEIERRIEIPRYAISQTQLSSEYDRLHGALEKSTEDLSLLEAAAASEPQLGDASVLMSAYASMAKDIAKLVKEHIGNEFVNVEQALHAVIAQLASRFAQMDNVYFREREQDVRDVGHRMMRHLAGASAGKNVLVPPGSIVVARELLPSETLELAKSGTVAIVSEYGGEFSHTAILARSLGIPAVSGIANVTSRVTPGMRLLVDGESGRVLEPTDSEMQWFATQKHEFEIRVSASAIDENLPCVTRDGVEISLMSNVCLPVEVAAIAKHNLAGVGLFRTEFLFIESRERPSFERQVDTYTEMARGLGDLPFVIRTFDLGGDKLPPFLLSEKASPQSNLHLRGLRFSLAENDLLDTQLRAILQVAQTSDIRVLFPMVIGSDDFSRAIAAIDRAADDLGVLRRPPVGAMIETPASLFALDEILALADFVAIGTNDLTELMLATDRTSTDGADICTAMHPAVIRAIKKVIEAAREHQCSVCVCGEEAGNVDFSCLLVGLGIRELSMTATRAAAVRQALRQIDSQIAVDIAESALLCQTPHQVRELCATLAAPASLSSPAS